MNAQTDQQLLRDYAGSNSEAAFAELVRRHIDLVYSAALRMVCDSHQAEDVTQGVFVALAQNARQLTHHPVLSGWLHRTTQNLAANAVRTNVRRQTREQEAVAMNELLSAGSDVSWEHIAPHLDAALGELSEPDRDALLLRYFEKQSAREMAQALGISDEAAQKRVSRAIERLREFFAKRGVTIGASGLAVVISANAVQAAPVGSAVAISSAAALAGVAVQAATAIAATKAITMTTLQKAVLFATLAAAVGSGIYVERHVSQLNDQLRTLQQREATLAQQSSDLRQQLESETAKLATSQRENERLRLATAELARLRAETARLRADSQELARSRIAGTSRVNDSIALEVKSWLARVDELKQRLEQMPDKKIPELQWLTDKDWLTIARDADLETDAGLRQAFRQLRSVVKNTFAKMIEPALLNFAQANQGQLPADLSQLKPYFATPVDDAILQRYRLLQTGNLSDVPPSDGVVRERAPVDDDYDSLLTVGPNGAYSMRDAKTPGTNGTGGGKGAAASEPLGK